LVTKIVEICIATQGSGLGLDVSVSRRTNVSSRSRLFTSRVQDVVTSCFLRQGVMHGALEVDYIIIIAPCKLTLCIIIIITNGRENKFTSAIVITCRPILTSRDLQTSRLGLGL